MDFPNDTFGKNVRNVDRRNMMRIDRNPSLAAQLIACGEIIMAIFTDEFNAFRANLPRIQIHDVINRIQRRLVLVNFRKFIIDWYNHFLKSNAITDYSKPCISDYSNADTTFRGAFTGCTLCDIGKIIRTSNLPAGVIRRTFDFSGSKPEFDEDDKFTATNFDSVSEVVSERDSGMSSQKVAALEMEIEMLKRQLQMVVNIMGTNNPDIPKLFSGTNDQIARSTTALSGAVTPNHFQNSANLSAVRPATINHCPPPPPPLPKNGLFAKLPPAPSLPPSNLKSTQKAQSPKEDKENRGGDATVSKPAMKDILQGISNITLKKVPKSPGGTPCQTKQNSSDKHFLKMMIEQKFKNTRLNDSHDSSDWDD